MNAADLIAAILKLEGIDLLPCFPHNEVIEAGSKIGIRPVIVRQERQALHIADGYIRASGGRRLCATTVQYGPGSENALGGVAQCFADNVPVLHLPSGYPVEEAGTRPNFNGARNMQLMTKHCETVLDVTRLPTMLANAFAMLRSGRPGPVVLEMPLDLLTKDVDPRLLDRYRPAQRSAPCADHNDLERIVEAVLSARAPVIVAGQGLFNADACSELLAFAELTGTPVLSTLNGKSVFPEEHPLYLGCGGRARPDAVAEFLDRADVIVGLGTSFTRSPYITPYPIEGRRFAQLTNWEGDIGKDYPIDLVAIGDAKPSLKAMIGMVGTTRTELADRRSTIEQEIAETHAAFMAKWEPILTSDAKPITPYRIVNDLMKVIDRDNSVVTHDAGSPREQITAFYKARAVHGYIGWGKTTQLGAGLGLVQGAKLARPDATCVNFMGDSAIGMVGMDFETGVRARIGTTTIVFKNSIMGCYSDYLPEASRRYAVNELGGDYAAMARAFGGWSETVEDPAAIGPMLQQAFAKNKEGIPALVQVITCEEKRLSTRLPKGTVLD